MATRLYVAAGGGGDALAALLLHSTLGNPSSSAMVMSYSWDRYVVDPEPGPRSVEDFVDLRPVTAHCWEISAQSHLRWPGTPTLPLLGRLTGARFVLLDPHQGAAAMREAIAELAVAVDAEAVTLVDVGGDVVAEGHEASLRSPLADSLALAALAGIDRPSSVVVAGPGLDGELPTEYVSQRCHQIAARIEVVTSDVVAAHRAVLREHPSEATALLAAAALGIYGQIETRDSGAMVAVTEASSTAYVIPHEQALRANRLARRLIDTTSLTEAEKITNDECGRCELTYERSKAAARVASRIPSAAQMVDRVAAYRETAKERGASHGTLRRLCEIVGLQTYDHDKLRHLVGNAHAYLPLYPL